MLTRTHVACIVGQFFIDAFDERPVKIRFEANSYMFNVAFSLVPCQNSIH